MPQSAKDGFGRRDVPQYAESNERQDEPHDRNDENDDQYHALSRLQRPPQAHHTKHGECERDQNEQHLPRTNGSGCSNQRQFHEARLPRSVIDALRGLAVVRRLRQKMLGTNDCGLRS